MSKKQGNDYASILAGAAILALTIGDDITVIGAADTLPGVGLGALLIAHGFRLF